MRPRISIRGSVRRSLCNPFFLNAENEPFSLWKSSGQSNIDIAECAWCAGCAKCAKCASCASYMCFIHVLHVLYMPMDALLACWALLPHYILRTKQRGCTQLSLHWFVRCSIHLQVGPTVNSYSMRNHLFHVFLWLSIHIHFSFFPISHWTSLMPVITILWKCNMVYLP